MAQPGIDYIRLPQPPAESDLQQIRELLETVFGPEPSDAITDFFWRAQNMPQFSAFVARSGDRLVGFKLGYAHTRYRYYSWLGGVHPDFRRSGIARALMEAQHTWLRQEGFRSVETGAREDNAAMIALNESCGFEVVGSRRKGSLTDTILAKELSP